MPADDDNSWLKEEKHPNQIKSRNRCCLELNTFQRLVSKGIMALFILHVSRPAQPLPLPQTTYDGWCGGWLWNGLTYCTCSTPEMKFIFRALFVPLPHFVLPSLAFSLHLLLCFVCHIQKLQTVILWVTLLIKHWNGGRVRTGPCRVARIRQDLILRDEITLC